LDPNRSLAVSETIANGDLKFNGVDLSNPDFDFQLYDTVVIAIPCNNHEPKPDDIAVDEEAQPSVRLDAGKIYVNVVVNNSNSDSHTTTNTNQADQSSSNSSSAESSSNASSQSDAGIHHDVTDVIIVDRPRNTVLAVIGAAIGISCFGIGYGCAQKTADDKADAPQKAPEPAPSQEEEVIHSDNGETR
jgi:hypothetical protein